jgi:hypothetical protein
MVPRHLFCTVRSGCISDQSVSVGPFIPTPTRKPCRTSACEHLANDYRVSMSGLCNRGHPRAFGRPCDRRHVRSCLCCRQIDSRAPFELQDLGGSKDPHNGNWTVSELVCPYGGLHVGLLWPAGEVHQLTRLRGESCTVTTCPGRCTSRMLFLEPDSPLR